MAQQSNIPLAERLRPRTLDDYIGQEHLVGPGGVFRKFIETGNVPSFILWGPPGVGKTTLARLVAGALDRKMFTLSAINSGVKDVREVIEQARKQKFFNTPAPFLFIDEIHRFNKAQQDSLLGAVEQGDITLVGATTENPSFEVISPLLSRCQVYVLKAMDDAQLQELLDRALSTDAILRERHIEVRETGALFGFAGGDARKLLNILDIVAGASDGDLVIDDRTVTDALQQNIATYDKNGEMHYDIISAFIKSVRGSDPNAAVYYLARMLNALGIRRRMPHYSLRAHDRKAREMLARGGDALQAFIDEYSSPLKDLGHIHTACYMRDILEVGRETPDLSGVGFPVLVIGASSGTFTDAGRMQEWVRSLRDGSWAVVNCFHWPLTECPEEVSRIIEEWIGREFRG